MAVLCAYAVSLATLLPPGWAEGLREPAKTASHGLAIALDHDHHGEAGCSSCAVEARPQNEASCCSAEKAEPLPSQNVVGGCGEACCAGGCPGGAFCGCATLSLPASPLQAVRKAPCHAPSFPERAASPLPGALTLPGILRTNQVAFGIRPIDTANAAVARLADQTCPLPATPPPRGWLDLVINA
jgi:hypothetical protein